MALKNGEKSLNYLIYIFPIPQDILDVKKGDGKNVNQVVQTFFSIFKSHNYFYLILCKF